VNNHSFTETDVKLRVSKYCTCVRYCWADKDAPWVSMIPLIRHVITKAIESFAAYVQANNLLKDGTSFKNHSDILNLPFSDELIKETNSSFMMPFLPIIPDISIQYRCSDNIRFGRLGYGLLPFRAFIPLINPNSKFIYVLTEGVERTHSQGFCNTIVEELIIFSNQYFSAATILLSRGGDMYVDFMRLAKTNIAICSASTFCFWPILASNGTTHFPLTNLIVGADPSITNRENAPNFGPTFNWIFEPETIFGFRDANEQLLNLLSS
jgi:hypothetical protein